MTVLCTGCSISDLVKVDPSTQREVDADVTRTFSGSIALYNGTIKIAAQVLQDMVFITGLMTDELQAWEDGFTFDARDDEIFDFAKIEVWSLMAATQRSIQALKQFPSETPPALLSELYALQGMAAIWMAEAYCSGVPLTKSPLVGNFSYTRGHTTAEVLHHAVALLDTALTFGEDSVRIATLARVGMARALMSLNEYDSASRVVMSVPTGASYLAYFARGIQYNGLADMSNQGGGTVTNREGGNGLRWVAGNAALQDPRVPLQFSAPIRQNKYRGANTTIRMADGIEARLIEAEAALRANNPLLWARLLNDLRASAATSVIPPLSADSTTLADSAQRVNVMFRERAYWLYLTGHRQGDLRRLIRHYGRSTQTVYPVGGYPWAGEPQVTAVLYNDFVTIPPPTREVELNPLYDGCFSRDP